MDCGRRNEKERNLFQKMMEDALFYRLADPGSRTMTINISRRSCPIS